MAIPDLSFSGNRGDQNPVAVLHRHAYRGVGTYRGDAQGVGDEWEIASRVHLAHALFQGHMIPVHLAPRFGTQLDACATLERQTRSSLSRLHQGTIPKG